MMPRALAALVSLLSLLTAAPPAAAAPGADQPGGEAGDSGCRFEYLHIEAGEGMSSGGHAAACFSDVCYHFVHVDGGRLQLRREARGRLELGYRVLGNRAIHALAPPIEAAACARARNAFEQRWRAGGRQAETLQALEDDVALTSMASGASDDPSVPLSIPASGYFDVEAARPPALDRLRARVARAGTASVFAQRRDAAAEAMREALIGEEPQPPRSPRAAGYQPPWHGRARGWTEAASWRLAAVMLEHGGLAADALAADRPEVAPLEDVERRSLERARDGLEARLARLFIDGDPAGGYAMLLGMARLVAIDESLASARLRVLDVYPHDAETFDAALVADHREVLGEVLRERVADARREREAFFSQADWSELHYSRMETSTALLADLAHALAEGGALRVPQDALLPQRAAAPGAVAAWPDSPASDPAAMSPGSRAEDEARLAAAVRRRDLYRDGLDEFMGYDLLRANCVTELFDVLAEAGTVEPLPVGAVSPALAATALLADQPATEVRELPSRRIEEVARRSRRHGALATTLVESNVVTSSLYRPHPGDSPFLFFGDGAGPLRPLAGAANLAVAMTEAVAGVAWWPVDGGRLLGRSLSGMLSSTAELGFVSIRKGTLVFAPMAWLPGQERGSQER